MKNLEKMTSKELKALAKELHVANWWNLNKASLIDGIKRKQIVNNETISEEQEIEKENKVIPIKSNRRKRAAQKTPAVNSEEILEEHKQNTKANPKKPNLKLTELTYKGKTQSIKAWAEELEMPWPTLYDRVNRNGWSVEDAIEIPLGKRRPK